MDTELEREMEKMKIDAKAAEEIMAADPKIGFISAMVMASDLRTANEAWESLINGTPYDEAKIRVGSFARLDWTIKALDAGYVSLDQVLDELPELWRGSDPDDTNPRFLELWRAAFIRNDNYYVYDEALLPEDDSPDITIYRGQDADAEYGIAWSLDRVIAEKFANGAATRQANRGGVVIMARVDKVDVLGYLTGRGESEVIVDPKDLHDA
jgi:hypothetical protein